MKASRPRNAAPRARLLLVALSLVATGCAPSDPLLSFLDEESNVSFTHPPRWSVGFAEQSGVRYRYLTAPKIEGDAVALSATLISPVAATSADAVAQAYLAGASEVTASPGPSNASTWGFKDSSGVRSRLQLAPAGTGRFFGAWVRGSDAAMKRYQSRIDVLLASLRVEDPTQWPEEKFAGLIARVPPTWDRGSRLSSSTNATMQFKSLPLFVEKGASTIHGFVTVSREPVPPPGDLETFNKLVKARASDTVALLEHHPWLALEGVDRTAGYVDYMRSGTALTSTRIRRWITVKNGMGLTLSCEARADAFDRLDPWCRRLAYTVRLD
jgi:hypothetical protein